MASIPHETVEANNRDRIRRSSSENRERVKLSHGRGGAGNIGSTPSDLDPITLETPTLKSDIFTTGRGGAGNMAKNTDPEAARLAQDVVGHPRRASDHSTHVGRGGAANIFRPSATEVAMAKEQNAKAWECALADEDEIERIQSRGSGRGVGGGEKGEGESERRKEMGFADRGKGWLGGLLGGRKG